MHQRAHAVASGVTVGDEAPASAAPQTDTEHDAPSNGAGQENRSAVARQLAERRAVDHAALDDLASQLRRRTETRYERLFKPVMDRVLAVLLILVLSPVLAVVALSVLGTIGRPVFFGQVRAGRHGRAFPMLKFRTMLPDRRCIGPDCYDGPERRITHKSADDPRHTRLGRWMRKLSLDELPQLFNVISGRMSLVGPRPEIFGLTSDYARWQHARHLVKPGVTGLWQTTERGKGLLLHECIDLDLRYIERLSLREDLRILARTPIALLRNRGVV